MAAAIGFKGRGGFSRREAAGKAPARQSPARRCIQPARGAKLLSAMAAESPDKQRCDGCGAALAANLRYCVNCYRPVAGARQSQAHVETARRVTTTRRADPTVVFMAEAHEARLRRRARRKRAATVMAVVILLTTAAIAAWLTLTHRSPEQRRATARSEMARRELNLMAEALEHFRGDVGRYPTGAESLRGLIHRPAAFAATADARVNQWFGPYLDSLPEVDPWGNDYVYETTGDGQSFRLYSYGPGGETGAGGQLQVSSSDPRQD
jgi:general secretion pathway protein G